MAPKNGIRDQLSRKGRLMAAERGPGADLANFLDTFGDALESCARHRWSDNYPAGLRDDADQLAEASKAFAETIRRSSGFPSVFDAESIEALAQFFARYESFGARVAGYIKIWPSTVSPSGIVIER